MVQVWDFASTGNPDTSVWKTVSAGIRVQPQNVDRPSGAVPNGATVRDTVVVAVWPGSPISPKDSALINPPSPWMCNPAPASVAVMRNESLVPVTATEVSAV